MPALPQRKDHHMAVQSANRMIGAHAPSWERVRRVLRIAGPYGTRYLLVGVIGLNAALKWTAAEASAIQPLLANSPFYAWLYQLGDPQAVSELFGVIELAIAALLALRPVAPRLSLIASAMAAAMFLSTTSFLLTTPGIA